MCGLRQWLGLMYKFPNEAEQVQIWLLEARLHLHSYSPHTAWQGKCFGPITIEIFLNDYKCLT